MGLVRIMMPPRFQLLAVLAFGVTMLFIENQIQKLEESRARLGKTILTRLSKICSVHVECLQYKTNLQSKTLVTKTEDFFCAVLTY